MRNDDMLDTSEALNFDGGRVSADDASPDADNAELSAEQPEAIDAPVLDTAREVSQNGSADDVATEGTTENKKEKKKKKKESSDSKPQEPFLYELISVLISAFVIIAVVFTFLFRPVGVNGSSMLPTLTDGDWVLVSTYYSAPVYGDIVVSTQPNDFNEPIIKRVIAVGGQLVDIDWNTGYVYVDGVAIYEPYTNSMTTDHTVDEKEFPLYVPYGYVFVMGDNRNDSTDSRSNMIGFISEDYLLGKVIFRVWPFGSLGSVS